MSKITPQNKATLIINIWASMSAPTWSALGHVSPAGTLRHVCQLPGNTADIYMPARPSSTITAATIVPTRASTRAPKLAEASFLGRFDAHLAAYDSLPSLDDAACQDEPLEITDAAELADRSLLNKIPETHSERPLGDRSLIKLLDGAEELSLAAIAERTRSQLLEQRSRIQLQSGCSGAEDSVMHDEAAEATASTSVHFAPASHTAARTPQPSRTAPPPQASMMTHAPSRMTHPTNGGKIVGGGHTFGRLPRASPSGMMPHQKPKADGAGAGAVPVARQRPQRPSSARARMSGNAKGEGDEAAGDGETNDANGLGVVQERANALARFYGQTPPTQQRQQQQRRQSSRERPKSAGAIDEEKPGGTAVRAFGADVRGGALSWGRPPTRSRVPLGSHVANEQPVAKRGAAARHEEKKQQQAAPARTKPGSRAFAFVHEVQECCGEEFDGFCCKRHHPDDSVRCCREHASVVASAFTRSRLAAGERSCASSAAAGSSSAAEAGSSSAAEESPRGSAQQQPPSKSLQGSSLVVAKRAAGAGGRSMLARYERLVLSSDSHLGSF